MKNEIFCMPKIVAACMTVLPVSFMCLGYAGMLNVHAEEYVFEDSTLSDTDDDFFASDDFYASDLSEESTLAQSDMPENEEADSIFFIDAGSGTVIGSYLAAEGWYEDTADAMTDDTIVYRQDLYKDKAETSMISCSYMETNYSVQEYEQLREMLTNNLIYSNVNAQISTSALYTLQKDYLYIILVDDSAEDYRDIYNYVVGNYRCFCVQVKEYREEAAWDEALEMDTPCETGQKMAESFIWDTED